MRAASLRAATASSLITRPARTSTPHTSGSLGVRWRGWPTTERDCTDKSATLAGEAPIEYALLVDGEIAMAEWHTMARSGCAIPQPCAVPDGPA